MIRLGKISVFIFQEISSRYFFFKKRFLCDACFLETRIFTAIVWLIKYFATQLFCIFLKANMFSKTEHKKAAIFLYQVLSYPAGLFLPLSQGFRPSPLPARDLVHPGRDHR